MSEQYVIIALEKTKL